MAYFTKPRVVLISQTSKLVWTHRVDWTGNNFETLSNDYRNNNFKKNLRRH